MIFLPVFGTSLFQTYVLLTEHIRRMPASTFIFAVHLNQTVAVKLENSAIRKSKNMQGKFAFHQVLFLVCAMPFFGVACNNDDESKLEGQWQMRQLWEGNTVVYEVDSVFYNFMDGIFTAICMGPEGQYQDFYGKYQLEGDVLQIHSLYRSGSYEWDDAGKWDVTIPDSLSTQRFLLAWPAEGDGEWPRHQVFRLVSLSSSAMELASGDSVFVFRKY